MDVEAGAGAATAAEDRVRHSLTAADDASARGDARTELSRRDEALRELLAIAVRQFDSSADGIGFLRACGTDDLLLRCRDLNATLLRRFRDGARDAAVDNDVERTHIAWLLALDAVGDAQLAIACDRSLARFFPHTRFWTEYHRALGSLVSRAPYVAAPPPKLKGYEKHWVPYLDLVEALTAGADPDPALARCAVSFRDRNRDRRLIDWTGHDGDGRHPVRWDFRAAAILTRAGRRS